ncbi:LANO_0F10264g1_1 [Lachancea nothofagi CBS 11611]|uniref:Structural maintenance of chromosomes protein n=1 Tax=Lachancea nothofagi CBS 11611 TaxID=1266666 RepID=A0A1G4KAD2_9SACH|nr:LANO_0F10264g1_1 [Lachancea nothofagi CBS 11611]
MKVEELIIDGFKSYATRTVISDWDPQFNAITGLNGSGKSNILDSICFVLGISSMATVRASNLQDLIYKRGQAGVTKASVTIVFDNSDKKNSPIGFETYPQISVTRQIMLGGTSKYLINGHRAQQQTVLHLFQSVQLNINNPNFLIMQGKITKVLNMKPTEILSLIEEAAGTKMFEDRREKAERTMAKKETKLQEIRTLLNEEIEPKLEKLRSEKRQFLEYQDIQSDLETTSKVVHSFTYNSLIESRKHIEENHKFNNDRIHQLNELLKKAQAEMVNLEEDLNVIRDQKRNEMKKNGTLSQLEVLESQLNNEVSRLRTTLNITTDNLTEETTKAEKLKQNINKFQKALEIKNSSFMNTEAEFSTLNCFVQDLKNKLQSKEELLSTLTTGISSTGATNAGYGAQLNSVKVKLNDARIQVQRFDMKIDLLRKELAANEPKLIKANSFSEEVKRELEANKMQCAGLNAKLQKLGFNPDQLKQLKEQEIGLKNKLYNTTNELEVLKRKVANIEFSYSKPSPHFNSNSVKGVAAQLFSLDENNFNSATALQICAGGRLFNVVVDNEKTASQLLEGGRLRKRVTIIPLNKISARSLNQRALSVAKELAPGNVELALNLIGYQEEVSRAMEFIFGTSLICKDAESAKKVTFHPQVRARSITLQGDVYDPEGTLSGGSRNNNSSILIDIQKYNALSKIVMNLEADLNKTTKEIEQYSEMSATTKSIQHDLNLATHKLHLSERNFENNPSVQLLTRNKEINGEIAECQESRNSGVEEVGKLEVEYTRIQKDMEEFSKDKSSKLDELKTEIHDMRREIEEKKNVLDKQEDFNQSLQLEIEQLKTDTLAAQDGVRESAEISKELTDKQHSAGEKLEVVLRELEQTKGKVEEEKKRLYEIDEEMRVLSELVKTKNEQLKNDGVELKKLTNETSKLANNNNSVDESIKVLLRDEEWLKDESLVSSILIQNQGINLQAYRQRSQQLNEKFNGMKRKVNPNIMSMIENVEKKESALKTMITTIEKDKLKIQETISKLNEYKRETLVKTWEKVTVDFGQIFGELLPNSFAKLVPVEGKDVTEGLEVKIRLGSIWKESLAELSGGQRSLIALSLILALLQFKPAPMYILDEVDAALDLSHTQNIGHLIRTKFKGSQFIVVSLKEGMFNNANRVFRTRFQDGTSVVSAI